MAPPAGSFTAALLDRNIHDRGAFSCGEPSLDAYLKRQATQDVKRGIAQTHVLAPRREPAKVAGYVTLSSYAVLLTELPVQVARKLPHHERIPAILIGRLARDQAFRGVGLGELLLMHALTVALESSGRVGAHAVVVDALNDRAAAFYQGFGFAPFEDDPLRAFLPMATVRALFST